jgi:hypothetical protein
LAFTLDTAPKVSELQQGQSLSSQDGSTNPQASKPLIQPLPEPPQPQTTQLDSSQPISEQRRLELVKWISFWENQEMTWREQVKASWTSLKNSFEKQSTDTENTLKAKDAVISAQESKIAILTAQLERANSDKWVFGLIGALGGAVTVEAVNSNTHK